MQALPQLQLSPVKPPEEPSSSGLRSRSDAPLQPVPFRKVVKATRADRTEKQHCSEAEEVDSPESECACLKSCFSNAMQLFTAHYKQLQPVSAALEYNGTEHPLLLLQ